MTADESAERLASDGTASQSVNGDPAKSLSIEVIPRRNWGRGIATALSLAFVGLVLYVLANSENIKWDQVGQFLTFETVLSGVVVTIQLTLLAMLAATAIGIVTAIMRLSESSILRMLSGLYLWIFRGTPLLVQLIFWFNLALFIPSIGFGESLVSTNDIMTSFVAALLGLSLHEGAYMTEIVRGGILSVGTGQREAALSLGMTPRRTMRRIILPQALRVMVPAAGNRVIGMLKATSLVSVIAAKDLLTEAQIIYTRNYLVIELLIVASLWYLVLTTVASTIQYFVEERLSHEVKDKGDSGLLRRVVKELKPWSRDEPSGASL